MFDRLVKFHTSLPMSGLNLSYGHMLMDLRGENLKNQNLLGVVNIFWGSNIFWVYRMLGQNIFVTTNFGGHIFVEFQNGREFSHHMKVRTPFGDISVSTF